MKIKIEQVNIALRHFLRWLGEFGNMTGLQNLGLVHLATLNRIYIPQSAETDIGIGLSLGAELDRIS
jgi:hypothetical protein